MAAEAVHGLSTLSILASYGVDELVDRHPRAVLEAVAASAACRRRLSASAEFAALQKDEDANAWRLLVGDDEAGRRQAVAALLAVAPIEGSGSESARLREQVAALRRRVDDLGRAGRQETAVRSTAEVQRLRTRAERGDREIEQLRQSHRALAAERDEAVAELRSLRRSTDTFGSLHGRAQLLLDAVGRELSSTPAPSPAAEPAEHALHEARRRALEGSASSLRALVDLLSTPTHRPVVSGLRRLEVAVTPLGGGEEIGGSCLLVEIAGRRLLVDCGARPGVSRMDEMAPPGIAEALRKPIDGIFVTHAHHDHIGYLPAVVRAQRRVPPIFATPGTAALLPPMWTDAVRLLGDRHRLAARLSPPNEGPAEPPFGPADVDNALSAVRTVPFDGVGRLGDLEYRMFPAGHILGAAGLVLRAGERLVVISGDICDQPQASVLAADLGCVPASPDLLVLESTYCRDEHPGRQDEITRFVQDVEDVVRGGGAVLVPVFGLGRAQEVAMILRDRLPHVPVRIDGIARAVSRIYEDQWRLAGWPMRILADNVREVEGDRRLLATTFRRGVVVTTSGMLSGGPAVEWARAILPEPRSALFLCGYQDEDSPGHRLIELADQPRGRRVPFELLDGGRVIQVPVNARVARYGLSAHADRAGLVSIIDRVRPAATMLVHGNRRDQAAFRASLNASGRRAIATGRWTSA
jgi:Cft2 family RNA processing exonuclease